MAKRKWKDGERKGFTLNKPSSIQKIDGITIDMERVSIQQFGQWVSRSASVKSEGEMITLAGEVAEKVVIKWPFDAPITQEGWLALGVKDRERVGAVLAVAMKEKPRQGAGQRWTSEAVSEATQTQRGQN